MTAQIVTVGARSLFRWVCRTLPSPVHDAMQREFWGDLLDRHAMRETDLDKLDPAMAEHAAGNFWGMVCQTAHELGFKI